METIICLAYCQNCFLESRSTYAAEWEGSEASGKGIKEKGQYDSKREWSWGREWESYVKEDRDILEERDKRLEEDRRRGKHLQRRILLVTYLSTSDLMGFWSLLGQSKFEGLTLFRNVNHEGVDTVLATVTHYKCPVERVYSGFTWVKLKKISRQSQEPMGRKNTKF